MKKVALIGYGRFGKVLHTLLKDDFEVGIFHHKDDPSTIFHFAEVIFYCVPIESFEHIIKRHTTYFNSHLLIDVLSVKSYPKTVFTKYLKGSKSRSLLTHPMFGPDSSRDGFHHLPIVMDKNTATDEEYVFWKKYFVNKGLTVVELSAKDHDQLAAYSQGLTHFIGRLLEKLKLKESPIDTLGTKKLLEVVDQTCNDSWQLFHNLQNYNSFTKKMRLRLGKVYDSLYNSLLPKRVHKGYIVFGIQGGRGSFNEEAIMSYIKQNSIKKYKIVYLYTSEKVLKNLHEGTIDFGIFAVQNAVGGVVSESTYAMAKYKFNIVKEINIEITHHLMKRKDISFSKINMVMAHDQVFKQCKSSLKQKYPLLPKKVGDGDYIDHAKVAWAVAKGILPKNISILGPRILADIYNFDIVDSDLQDQKNNITTFFLVKR